MGILIREIEEFYFRLNEREQRGSSFRSDAFEETKIK